MKLIQSIERAVKIMDLVSAFPDGIRLKELARNLRLGSSTVYNLAHTLCVAKLLRQDSKTNKYQLGSKTLQLGNCYLDGLSLHQTAQPAVAELAERFNENFYLTMLEGKEMLPLIRIESTHSVRPTRTMNAMANSHATAIGKVLLASFSLEDLHLFICSKPLERYTNYTITSESGLIAELEKVRRDGYAMDMEESEIGINCIGVPVRNHRGTVIAAIGTSIPTQRFSMQVVDSILPRLKDACQSISQDLGYFESSRGLSQREPLPTASAPPSD